MYPEDTSGRNEGVYLQPLVQADCRPVSLKAFFAPADGTPGAQRLRSRQHPPVLSLCASVVCSREPAGKRRCFLNTTWERK